MVTLTRGLLTLAIAALSTAQSSDVSVKIVAPTTTFQIVATSVTAYGSFTSAVAPKVALARPVTDVSVDDSTSGQANRDPNAAHGPNNRGNWLPGYTINTDYDQNWPNTGNIVRYTLRLQNKTLAPDGVPKQMLVFNGQYPGPKIEANWGDILEITVINELQINGTSIHWHGLRQFGSNLADGVNGVTECPFAPGDSKVYRFQATQYGTSWYHSHFSAQYGDGVAGRLSSTVLPPQEDYYAHRNGPPTAQNYLLNGQNVRIDGTSGTRARWTFTAGKRHRLRIINTSLDALFKIQIDDHLLQGIATDFVPIVPYFTQELSVAIGQRYDIIVNANQTTGNYWFRAMAARQCTANLNHGTGNQNGIISYSNAPSVNALPTTTNTTHSDDCVDEAAANLVPIVQNSVDSGSFQSVAKTLPVNVNAVVDVKSPQKESVFQWTLGGISQVIDWANPTMGEAAMYNNTYDSSKNVLALTRANEWVYFIVQNQFFVPHPMHLHGHDFNVLGQGNGTFDPSANMGNLNFVNPPRRDVVMLIASGWTVIAFKTDNPGAWLFHCHIAWHVGAGLSLQFLERPVDIPGRYFQGVSSPAFQSTCSKWRTYAKKAPYQQYDSGLKRRTDGKLRSHQR